MRISNRSRKHLKATNNVVSEQLHDHEEHYGGRSTNGERPVHSQSELLATELNCTDTNDITRRRLGVFSCFCCNNYETDKVLSLNSWSQDVVNQKNMSVGVNQKLKLKFSIHRGAEILWS